MKTYYIFQIKKEFISLYKETPSTLFHILRSIYYLDKTEVEYGYNLFHQLIIPMNKNKIDRDIFIKLHFMLELQFLDIMYYINYHIFQNLCLEVDGCRICF